MQKNNRKKKNCTMCKIFSKKINYLKRIHEDYNDFL